MSLRLLITGATGFVGRALTNHLCSASYDVAVTSRSSFPVVNRNAEQCVVGSLSATTNWGLALNRVDVVVHCAARAHILDDVNEPLLAFREVNTAGTLNLARQAVEAGVERFIFLSSIGVNGNNNCSPYTEEDSCHPQERYAISKYEAELGLRTIANDTNMEVVIIRPPLVYGVNAPGNFASLLRWVKKGIPLPLGSIHNQRSFIALDNLVSFIILCIDHPKAANEVFLISDGEDVSTTELLQKVAKVFGKRAFLLPVPVSWMTFVAKLVGKEDVANRLFGSLQMDNSKARRLLGWKPVITMDEQLKKTAKAYLNEKTG
jgi:nucleoside-diphosphate-sugar epimerase